MGFRESGDPNLWPYGGSLEAAASFGANVVEAEVSEVIIDSDHKIVTSPAFIIIIDIDNIGLTSLYPWFWLKLH